MSAIQLPGKVLAFSVDERGQKFQTFVCFLFSPQQFVALSLQPLTQVSLQPDPRVVGVTMAIKSVCEISGQTAAPVSVAVLLLQTMIYSRTLNKVVSAPKTKSKCLFLPLWAARTHNIFSSLFEQTRIGHSDTLRQTEVYVAEAVFPFSYSHRSPRTLCYFFMQTLFIYEDTFGGTWC